MAAEAEATREANAKVSFGLCYTVMFMTLLQLLTRVRKYHCMAM